MSIINECICCPILSFKSVVYFTRSFVVLWELMLFISICIFITFQVYGYYCFLKLVFLLAYIVDSDSIQLFGFVNVISIFSWPKMKTPNQPMWTAIFQCSCVSVLYLTARSIGQQEGKQGSSGLHCLLRIEPDSSSACSHFFNARALKTLTAEPF